MQTVLDPLGEKYEIESKKSLTRLLKQFDPQTEIEKLLVEQVHFNIRCSDARATKINIGTLLKLQSIRNCPNDCQNRKIIEDF